MLALMKVLFFGALGLLVLIPLGIGLAVFGLPIAAVLCVVALPVLFVLFLIGLPFLIIFATVLGLLGAVFGVLMAFLSLGVVALKVAIVVLIPILIIGWVLRMMFGRSSAYDRALMR
jgi:hypothetical protein